MKSFWANDPGRACCVAWRADLARQPGAKHASATGATATCGFSSLFEFRLLVPDFQDEATSRDNGILEITTKTSPSAAENRCIGTAIATILPAKLSAAQNGAIHHPLSPPPSYPACRGSQATHRANPPPIIILPPMLTKPTCVAWPLTRPHSRARTTMNDHVAPLLRNATSGDMWGEGTRYEFLPGPHVSPRHITQRSARLPRS